MTNKNQNNLEIIEKNQDVGSSKVIRASRKPVERVLTFDAYFQILISRKGKIQIHHKAPMRKFAIKHGTQEGTEKDFDRLFRLY